MTAKAGYGAGRERVANEWGFTLMPTPAAPCPTTLVYEGT